MSDWHVYIIDRKEKLYVGITTDLSNRMRQHAVMDPLYVEGPMSKAEALHRERVLKGWTRKKKLSLISAPSSLVASQIPMYSPGFRQEPSLPNRIQHTETVELTLPGMEQDERALPDSRTDMHVTDMAYLLRGDNGAVEVVHDRHFMGLFPRTVWLELVAAAGFEPPVVPFEHSPYSNTGRDVFLGRRPVADGGT